MNWLLNAKCYENVSYCITIENGHEHMPRILSAQFLTATDSSYWFLLLLYNYIYL